MRADDLLPAGDAAGEPWAAPVGDDPQADPEGWNNRGARLYLRGDLAGALADFGRALGLRPEYSEALNNRGIVRHRLGEFAGALADFDRALDLRPRYTEALVNRGITRRTLGDLPGAIADFDRALGVRPTYADAYHERAAALHAWGDLDGALADYGRVLEFIPPRSSAPVRHLRAGVLFALKRFADAAAECDRVLELDPTFGMAYISRGNVRYHLRQRAALDDFRAAFALDAVAAAAEVVRFLADDAKKNADEVFENCRKHIRICPDDVLAYARRGLTLLLLGREAEAVRDIEETYRRAPEWADHLPLMIDLARSRPDPGSPAAAPRNSPESVH